MMNTVFRNNSGLPASVLAWLVLDLLQPSAALKDRVWKSGPVSVAHFTLDSTFSMDKRKLDSISPCRVPNGLGYSLAVGTSLKLWFEPSA